MSNKINRGTEAEVSPKTNERYIWKDESKKVKKYRVAIPKGLTHIGYFLTIEDAVQARDKFLSNQ